MPTPTLKECESAQRASFVSAAFEAMYQASEDVANHAARLQTYGELWQDQLLLSTAARFTGIHAKIEDELHTMEIQFPEEFREAQHRVQEHKGKTS